MQKKDVDIKITILNIMLVIGILLFLGCINTIVKKGVSKDIVIWMVIGISLIMLSIMLRIIYKKYLLKLNKEDTKETEKMLKDIISDKVIDEEEVEKIKAIDKKES